MVQNHRNSLKGSAVNDTVSGKRAITGDVSDSPNHLLDHLNVGGAQQLDEMRQHVFFNQIANMVRGAGGDVGQTPGSLELELRNLVMQQGNVNWDQVGVDDWLYWRLVFDGKESPHANQGKQLNSQVIRIDHLDQFVEIGHLQKKSIQTRLLTWNLILFANPLMNASKDKLLFFWYSRA